MRFYLTAALAILFTACAYKETPKVTNGHWSVIYHEAIISKYRIDGHDYIVFREIGTGAGITHAEDCPCKTKKQK